MAVTKKVFVDFHHSSLLRSLIMLFEDRLGYEVYRPIGIQWFIEGHWGINNQLDTAKQFLGFQQIPKDHTPPLNNVKNKSKGIYYCYDAGSEEVNRACTLEFFKKNEFDYVIASIPAHIPLYERLIRKYNRKAKLIVQMGNEWPDQFWRGQNVLASVAPRETGHLNCKAMFYHQEFDTKLFSEEVVQPTKNIYSFVNVLQNMPHAQDDFDTLEAILRPFGFYFASYGGQNRDGNMNGPYELSNKMKDAQFILHSKEGGDGFGHIIYNAYASGRPVIVRPSQYKDRLAEELFTEGTFLDLDNLGFELTTQIIRTMSLEELRAMGQKASDRFKEVVNYEKEAENIRQWLTTL